MARPARRPGWQWTTLLVSVALAATLGATLYFATSSLPYLASSPTTDPTFGELNACLHRLVPSRTGFAVARDARAAAVWSTNTLARCSRGTDELREETWSVAGITVGAFDGAGTLWVVSQPGGLASTLLEVRPGAVTPHGESGATSLVGTTNGIVVLEQSGRLVSLSSSGEATAVAEVPPGRGLTLSASADGERVAVTGDGVVRVFGARKLEAVRLEAPCDVKRFWWLEGGHRALLTCRADDLALVLDTSTGAQETAAPGQRAPSFLAGPLGPFVVACDVLPCTAEPPLEPRR
ncbi:MAG: hypothetical protein JNJ54_36540 [Myxococcaceae bacterium]|nr:hypothetical protein [Myxococcaceae bacterium]